RAMDSRLSVWNPSDHPSTRMCAEGSRTNEGHDMWPQSPNHVLKQKCALALRIETLPQRVDYLREGIAAHEPIRRIRIEVDCRTDGGRFARSDAEVVSISWRIPLSSLLNPPSFARVSLDYETADALYL